jgi:hypothetical protein
MLFLESFHMPLLHTSTRLLWIHAVILQDNTVNVNKKAQQWCVKGSKSTDMQHRSHSHKNVTMLSLNICHYQRVINTSGRLFHQLMSLELTPSRESSWVSQVLFRKFSKLLARSWLPWHQLSGTCHKALSEVLTARTTNQRSNNRSKLPTARKCNGSVPNI